MATYTAEKLSVLVQALDSIDLPNPFNKLKKKQAKGRSASPSSSLRPSRSTESFVVVPDEVHEPSERTIALQQSISALPPSKPSRSQLQDALKALDNQAASASAVSSSSGSARPRPDDDEEELLAWTLVGRVVLGLYGQTVEDLVISAGQWEDEIAWWRALDGRGRWAWGGIGGYLFATLPKRLSNLPVSLVSSALPSHIRSSSTQSEDEATSLARSTFTPTYLLSSLFPTTSIPRSTSTTSTALLLLDPRTLLRMTRREVHGRIRHLERGRDRIVRRLGKLTVEAPDFGLGPAASASGQTTAAAGASGKTGGDGLDTKTLGEEMKRVLELVWETSLGPLEHRPEETVQPAISSSDAPNSFLASLHAHLSLPPSLPNPPSHLTRPNALTRLWPPLLLLPLLIPILSPYIPVLKDAVRDAKETARGFWKGWVVEPLMGIIDTVRHGGGEGGGESSLSVMSKEGMKGDMESLERMVISLAQDKRNYSAVELAALTRRVREGDLTDVLKLYEDDIKSPLKSALTGSLVRSLLIQVQKTKVDVDFALQGIDKLLRSQELTFAFVGVAPSFLIVYLLGGWFRGFLSQAGGGFAFTTGKGTKKQRRRKSWDSIRRIERLLTLPPPPAPIDISKDQPTSDLPYEIQGLLLVSIAGLRTVGKNEFKRSEGEKKDEFMLDLLDLENPEVNREAKLRVVQRMWRCWGVRLGWVGTAA